MSPCTPSSRAGVRRAVREFARVDARALAALRIALGTLLLADLVLRSRSLRPFYTEVGIVSRTVLADLYPLHPSLSIHALSGDLWFQIVLFVAAGTAAVALAVGYRTRLAAVVSLVLLVSLHARNPTVLNSGDVLLRRVLFLSTVLPLGARWSIDATSSGDHRESVATLASLALLLQVGIVYATNAVFKLDSRLWLDGEAIGYILALDRYGVLLGPVLADIDPLVTVLDWAWLCLLIASPLLLLTTGRIRSALASLFVAMHLGMALTMDLGVFPLVSVASLLPFLPPAVWDRVERIPTPRVAKQLGKRPTRASTSGSSGAILEQYGTVRPAVHAVVLAALVLVSAMGVGLVPAPDGAPEQLSESSWTMFASPPTDDTWIVANGTFASGSTTDLLREDPTRLDRPPDVGRFPNARWRKHLSRYDDSSPLPRAYAAAKCRHFADREDALASVRLVRIRRHVDDDPEDASTSEIGRYRCTDHGVSPVDADAER